MKLSLNLQVNFPPFELVIEQELTLQGITGIFGHSGSGKSTLLRVISGLEKNITGDITFNDRILINSDTDTFVNPEHREIGIVFQDTRLFPHLNVLDNLRFALKRRKTSRLSIDRIIKLTELDALLNKPIDELSGGQKQRVSLARAILAEPKLLLLDEPLSALDRQAKVTLLKLLHTIQHELQLPILYVSHSVDELQQVCDKLLVLSQGKVIGYGGIHQMIHELNHNQISGQIDEICHQQTSLSLPIKTLNNGHGLAELSLSPSGKPYNTIYLPAIEAKDIAISEKTLRCFILARDISISLTEPANSSIVNHLLAKIVAIDIMGNKVLLTTICGGKGDNEQTFFVAISTFSQQKLALTINQDVYLQFKASAVRTYLY